MKQLARIALIICLLMLKQASGQEMFRLLTDKPVVLDKGWKYKMADNPSYALPKYNDQGWKPIKANLDVHKSLPADADSGIGWMRLKFFVGKKIRGETLALKIHQSVASEIYLNGKLLASYGVISADGQKVKAFDPVYKPIIFSLSDDSVQVLAVRFAVQPDIKYTTIFGATNSLLSIGLSGSNDAVEFYQQIFKLQHSFLYLLVGIWIMMFIIYTSFFLLVPSLKANVYFSLYALCNILASLIQLSYYLYSQDVNSKMIKGNVAGFILMLGGIFVSLTVYIYLKKKIDTNFKALLVLFVLTIFLNAGIYDVGAKLGGSLFQMLLYGNLIRISVISSKDQNTGAGILAIGSIATVAFFVFFVLQGSSDSSFFALDIERRITYILYTLSIPIAISVLLARDFAFTSKGLQQKLEEVNELSKKNLAVEKEKQDILASQNQQLDLQVKQRTSELTKSLEDLKSAQSQLIQSEKMASLGELTAGIAHEIQNPLNFVNNFSEVNMELSDEILEAVKKGELDAINHLAADIKSNQEKILEHGHRADGIVKSMLQHSRSNTSNKELTDINILVDEYARLSYHGIKAKDKTFNVTFKADFDVNAGSCNIIPQDIGRVLLNLLNNAFYAVQEKKAGLNGEYQPEVTVTTKRENDALVITVADNGNGIPDSLREKIFQPFFTTKPTGSGTGLGLSLSYDIIKAHGGEFNLVSTEGSSTKFIIQLPT